MAKITEYTQADFTGDKIDNCLYVDYNRFSTSVVKLSTIFEEIKRRSLEDKGLTVEFTGDNIIFIKGKK